MAETAPATTATAANTVAVPEVEAETEKYTQWDPQAWWDNPRWTLTGAQPDSDYKAGLWWQDAQDMKGATPAMRQAADDWDAQVQQLQDAKAKIRSARTQLETYTGADAQAQQQALDNLDKGLNQRIASVEPLGKALRNSASVIESNFPQVQTQWNNWENDRGNAPQCHADTVAMTQPTQNMARAMLDAANAVQKGFAEEIEPAEVEGTAAPTARAAGTSGIDPDVDGLGNAQVSGGLAGTAQNVSADSSGNGTGAGANGTDGTGVAAASHGGGTAAGTAPGTVVTSGTTGTAGDTPTLAGAGAGTLAPPTAPTAPGLGAGPVSAGSVGGFGGGGFSGGGAGFVPFGGGTTGAGGSTFGPFVAGGASGGSRGNRSGERDDRVRRGERDDQQRREGAAGASPMLGGAGLAGRAAKRNVQIRPGDATRSGRAAGVAAGLLGRAAKDADIDTVGTSSARRRSGGRRDENTDETVRFLDEEAWLTDDPGKGVIKSDEPGDARDHNGAAGPRPMLG